MSLQIEICSQCIMHPIVLTMVYLVKTCKFTNKIANGADS